MKGGSIRIALITGGAGFIGSNLAERLLRQPDVQVRIFDNLSRHGAHHNLDWLRTLDGRHRRLEFVQGDVRDSVALKKASRDVTEIYHLAAQVAVTTSLVDPATDFSVNAEGTLNVLEAARASDRLPFLLFTSTNKVYGSLSDIPIEVESTHYRPTNRSFEGVNETQPLDFHSPYGCSKGAADQYVRDFARMYGLPSVVFRMSCIAGPRQFGTEDQGWVAHFLYSVLARKPIIIYGNGYQVRDVLHVHDLVDAMIAARSNIERTRGEIYNIGGGLAHVISIREMLQTIKQITRKPLHLEHRDVRPGDQPLYISDTRKLHRDTGWTASRSLQQMLEDMHAFWCQNRAAIAFDLPLSELTVQEVA
jgi:CDP-paratose 2-epimerase